MKTISVACLFSTFVIVLGVESSGRTTLRGIVANEESPSLHAVDVPDAEKLVVRKKLKGIKYLKDDKIFKVGNSSKTDKKGAKMLKDGLSADAYPSDFYSEETEGEESTKTDYSLTTKKEKGTKVTKKDLRKDMSDEDKRGNKLKLVKRN